jgi:hypothetical protein
MRELEGRIEPGHGRHDLEVQVPGQGLRLVSVEAIPETKHEDVDAGVACGEVGDVGLDLDDVAYELVARVAVEAVVLAQAGRQVDPRPVDVAGRLEDEARHRAALSGTAREQVERADHVHLMGAPRIHVERVDAGQRVHDGVDSD